MLECSVRHTLHGSEGTINLSVDFAVHSGEVVGLYGPSGSGKTTILRMLAGLVTPERGSITVDGACWFDATKKVSVPPQKRGVGFVFQDYGLFEHMTVRKNISFALPKNGDNNSVDELLEVMGLTNLASRYPCTLSGGQQQRVALSRALALKPQLLLLDEPLSALDPSMRSDLQNKLELVAKTVPVATILVSHDLGELFRLATKVFHIENGVVVKEGSPREVFGETEAFIYKTRLNASAVDRDSPF